MKLKLMLSLGLLSIPFMANANGVAQFTLINGSPSLVYPSIEVQGGNISYYFSPGNPGCPTAQNPKKVDLTNVPFSIHKTGQQPTTYTFEMPSGMNGCFSGNNIAIVFLYITEVDGIPKGTDYPCGAVTSLSSKDGLGYAGLEIQKTSRTSFSCFNVTGAKK